MPRSPRIVIPDIPIHITHRGVDRGATFLDDNDCAMYLLALRTAMARSGCAVHAYVLMTNHVHLLVTPAEARGPATLMRLLGVWYVRYFNDRYRRTGPLWEGRYRSRPITSGSYFFTCSRYIERNPVRAGLVKECGTYAWSSFHHNACGRPDPIITAHPLYVALGDDRIAQSVSYRELFREDDGSNVPAEIRTAPFERGRLAVTTYQRAVAARLDASGGGDETGGGALAAAAASVTTVRSLRG